MPVNPYEPPQEENRREERPTSRFAYMAQYAIRGLLIGGIGCPIVGFATLRDMRDMQHFLATVLPNQVLGGAIIGFFLGFIVGLLVDILRWETKPPRRQDEGQ